MPESKLLKNLDQKKGSRNPLLPLRNYLILSKMTDDIRENSRETSLERLDKIIKSHKENNFNSINTQRKESYTECFKLSEMITLGLLSSGSESGTVKKMIHAPTLRMFAVKVSFQNLNLKSLGSSFIN